MSLIIPEGGLQLESSAKSMAALPLQAFAISLSDGDLEDMIACVQNGQNIQLSLGSTPSFVFGNHEVRIKDPEPSEFDLFYGTSPNATSISRLENPTMSIFDKPRRKQPKPAKSEKTGKLPEKILTKASGKSPRNGKEVQEEVDEATVKLMSDMAKAEQDKLDNSARLIDNIVKNRDGTVRGKSRLMGSHPGSPALSAISSPSLKPTEGSSQASQTQEHARQQRFPIIHELALEGRSYSDLREKYTGGDEQEFSSILNKVADFDETLQKYVLKKLYWGELDVFEYPYASEEDRKRAIDYLVKQYDRKRLLPTDGLWQKLLPVSDRGKSICISKLQPRMAAAQAAASKISAQKADGSSASGDSEKDDSSETANGKKMTQSGGEPMSRSNSKKKAPSSETQMRRILSGGGVRKTAAAKASPKPSPTKHAAKVATAPKGGFKSKEYVSDSSDDDEVPLAQSKPFVATSSTSVPKVKVGERLSEKTKTAAAAATGKPREVSAPKSKPKPNLIAADTPKEKEKDRERLPEKRIQENDTIEAHVIARPPRPSTSTTSKRARENDDDDSSSSGTPMMRSRKSRDSHQSQPAASQSKHAAVLAREKEREREREKEREARRLISTSAVSNGTGSTVMRQPRTSHGQQNRIRNVSPRKSSPLASSPPTNASDIEPDRPIPRIRDREQRERARERERERDREAVISSASSTNGDSSVSSSNGISAGSSVENNMGRKRKAGSDNSSDERHDSKGSSVSSKRPRVSSAIISKAHKFKEFYSRYEALHREILTLENPPQEKMEDLMEMRDRLTKMKSEIYSEVSVDR